MNDEVHKGTFRMMEFFHIIVCASGTWLCTFVNTDQTNQLTYVCHISIKIRRYFHANTLCSNIFTFSVISFHFISGVYPAKHCTHEQGFNWAIGKCCQQFSICQCEIIKETDLLHYGYCTAVRTLCTN
jgi:hypothetical protein